MITILKCTKIGAFFVLQVTARFMNKNAHCHNLKQPPKRLFWRVIERLKMEKHLKIFKEKFWIFFAAFIGSAILIAAAFLLLNSELKESESIPFLSLLFSDTFEVISYYKYFTLAILESIPIASVTLSLTAVALTMLLLRLVVEYREKILMINKLINKKTWI